jgi:polyferredoxin
LFATTGATLLIGAAFCGWLCPLGSVQDWIGRLGKKILGKRFNRVPYILDQILGYLRYVVLALVVIGTTRMINLVFASVDPYYALFHFWTGEALPSAIAVLAVVLVSSLFVERPWCRWLCPFGALQGILQLVSPWKIRRNPEICINCNKCARACPMRIKVSEKMTVLDTRCNRCGECLAACPVEGGLEHSLPGRVRIPLKNRLLPAFLVLTFFAAPIVISQQVGLFETSAKVQVVEGTLKAEEIKSSMTLEELAAGFNASLDALIEFLTLPEGVPASTKLRDLEDIDESLTTKAVRSKMSSFS